MEFEDLLAWFRWLYAEADTWPWSAQDLAPIPEDELGVSHAG